MVVAVRSGAVDGIDGYPVRVEVDAGRGLPGFQMVGLPCAAVRESRERVMSAVRNSGGGWPRGRVVVNLAPAEVRKDGASLDLAVAVGAVLSGAGERGRSTVPADTVHLGELGLSGELRPVRGLLAMVQALAAGGATRFVVPADQHEEARLVHGIRVAGAGSLAEVRAWHEGRGEPPWRDGGRPLPRSRDVAAAAASFLAVVPPGRRHLALVAVAGRHNMLLVGPPGSGKTRLCRAVGALTPPLDTPSALEVLRITGALGAREPGGLPERPSPPFRAPHHTVTRAGLIGGGAGLRPGEVTLAHRGVLFLDELTEFAPGVLDALREPLEEGRLAVSRGGGVREWPARFQLLAAMNPCRCGWLGSRRRTCSCPPAVAARHRARLSGPLLDRIDLFAEVDEDTASLTDAGGTDPGRTVAEAAAAVTLARDVLASAGPGHDLAAVRLRLSPRARRFLDEARDGLRLSVRSLLRCARVARTVAALDGRSVARRRDAATALGWRREAVLTETGAGSDGAGPRREAVGG